MFTGTFLNLLVMYVILKRKLLKRSINYFIFNMAVADILMCCFDISVRFSYFFTINSWVIHGLPGIISCKIILFLAKVSPIVSILSLVFMTLDRFLAIRYPTKSNLRTHKTRRTLLIISWLIPVLYSSTDFYSYDLYNQWCVETWGVYSESQTIIYTVFVNFYTVAFIFVPLVLLTLMYGAIAMTLKRGQAFSQNAIPTEQQRIRQKQRRRINILAFSIVLAFAICNGPLYFYVYISYSFVANWTVGRSPSFRNMVRMSWFLAYSNATINPIICIVFNQEIKRSVKKLIPYFIRRPCGGGSFDVGNSSMRSVELNMRTTMTNNSVHSRVNETVEME